MAQQSVRLKEEQLRREGKPPEACPVPAHPRRQSLTQPWSLPVCLFIEEKLREVELKSQREISEKRQELIAKEESLRNLETRLAQQQVEHQNGHQ